MKNFHSHHWDHVGHRIIGKPVVLIPRHNEILIFFRLITLCCLLISCCFTLVGFNYAKVAAESSVYKFQGQDSGRQFENFVEVENILAPKKESTWEDFKKAGELALIGFCFIVACQGFVAFIVFCGVCYRCWKLKRPARTWEVMPFCIGSTLLFLAGALECYYVINFKNPDDELPYHIKKTWLLAAILTLIGAVLGIFDTCLLLGSEARIVGTASDAENAVFDQIEKNKQLIVNY